MRSVEHSRDHPSFGRGHASTNYPRVYAVHCSGETLGFRVHPTIESTVLWLRQQRQQRQEKPVVFWLVDDGSTTMVPPQLGRTPRRWYLRHPSLNRTLERGEVARVFWEQQTSQRSCLHRPSLNQTLGRGVAAKVLWSTLPTSRRSSRRHSKRSQKRRRGGWP